ncbi:MAG: hypothetical protein LBP89_00220 [Helicobacteraceae bacterium]|jgi:hypothetical protein|nr:hypothetical protein [Helicobacteraceae bacterium]
MARSVDYTRYTEELGNILELSEAINRYTSGGRRRTRVAKAPKAQNDRLLVKLLKTKYALSEGDVGNILKIVEGKAATAVKTKTSASLSEEDRAKLKREIDALIAKIGITIRAENLSEVEYLRKIKGNLSVRKGKILAVVHPTRTPKAKA